jgi:D-tyrosyl-tRNA(Tyr) deacylase
LPLLLLQCYTKGNEKLQDKKMRALIQRVSRASVTVDEQVVGEIGRGLLVLLGVGLGDSEAQVKTVVDKIVNLRIFEDDEGKMNRSLLEVRGQVLVVSQFTLYADVRRGRRPSFTTAAPPSLAEPLVERFKAVIAAYGLTVADGIFGAMMQVELCNDGPVTIWMDSEEL